MADWRRGKNICISAFSLMQYCTKDAECVKTKKKEGVRNGRNREQAISKNDGNAYLEACAAVWPADNGKYANYKYL